MIFEHYMKTEEIIVIIENYTGNKTKLYLLLKTFPVHKSFVELATIIPSNEMLMVMCARFDPLILVPYSAIQTVRITSGNANNLEVITKRGETYIICKK